MYHFRSLEVMDNKIKTILLNQQSEGSSRTKACKMFLCHSCLKYLSSLLIRSKHIPITDYFLTRCIRKLRHHYFKQHSSHKISLFIQKKNQITTIYFKRSIYMNSLCYLSLVSMQLVVIKIYLPFSSPL